MFSSSPVLPIEDPNKPELAILRPVDVCASLFKARFVLDKIVKSLESDYACAPSHANGALMNKAKPVADAIIAFTEALCENKQAMALYEYECMLEQILDPMVTPMTLRW